MDKIKERIDKGLCPICGKKLDNNSKTINDPIYGKVWICKYHHTEEE